MNFDQTLKAMLGAAATVAKADWNSLRGFAQEEFKRLAESAAWLEADYLADMAAAQMQSNAERRRKMEKAAKRRAELAHENLKLAAGGLVTVAKADAKIAAQNAINAALEVLRSAINTSLGIPLL